MPDPSRIRYLSSADVHACLPSIERQLDLAAEALTALAQHDAEMPLKMGVHPRPNAVLHAMPAWLRTRDLAGLKWISTYPGNSALGRPPIDALIVMNDPETGSPTHILDGSEITAVRTAAVSGVAMKLYAPSGVKRVGILGAGVQGRSHGEVVKAIIPRVEFRIYDRHSERAAALARHLTVAPGPGEAIAVNRAMDAVIGADIVVSASRLRPSLQSLPTSWLSTNALVVAIDADSYASNELARTALAFVVDDRDRFRRYLDEGSFSRYPEPTITLGEAIVAGVVRAQLGVGRVLVTPLGIGLADLIFADAVCREADARGVGTVLAR